MHRLPLILMTILLAGLASCSQAGHIMDRAEPLIDTLPDSAVKLLQSIPFTSLSSASTRARHSLLLTRALYKSYAEFTDDSIISEAYRYYCLENHGSERDRMLASYLLAAINNDLGNIERAARYANVAMHHAKKTSDVINQALIIRLLAELSHQTNRNQKALELLLKSELLFRESDAKPYIDYLQASKGLYYSACGENIKAISVLDSLINNPSEDIQLQNLAMQYITTPMMQLKMYTQAKGILEKRDTEILPYSLAELCYLAELNIQSGSVADAEQYLKRAYSRSETLSDSVLILTVQQYKYERTSQADSLLYTKFKLASIKDRIAEKSFSEHSLSTINIEADQEINYLSDQVSDREKYILVLWIAIIVLACAATCSIVHIVRKQKFHISSVKNMQLSHTDLQKAYSLLKEEIKRLEIELADKSLTEERENKMFISLIVETYLRKQKNAGKQTYSETEICKCTDLLTQYINTCKARSADSLLKAFPDLKQEDRLIYIYTAAGIPTDIIMSISNMSTSQFNTRKSRLKKKIMIYFNLENYDFGMNLPLTD